MISETSFNDINYGYVCFNNLQRLHISSRDFEKARKLAEIVLHHDILKYESYDKYMTLKAFSLFLYGYDYDWASSFKSGTT